MLITLITLLGCADDKSDDSDTQDTEVTDTNVGDTAVAEDTEDTEDTDDTEVEPSQDYIFQLSNAEGSRIGIAKVDFDGDDNLIFGDVTVASLVLGDSPEMGILMDDPQEEDLQPAEEGSTMMIGIWSPFLFIDANENDEYDAEETVTGMTNHWLLWSSESDSESGLTIGWNTMQYSLENEESTITDNYAVPLSGNIEVRTSISFGGDMDPTIGERRVAFVPPLFMEEVILPVEEQTTTPFFDQLLSESWTVNLDGTPPDTHFLEEDFQLALEVPLVYMDADMSGSLNVEDLVMGVNTICSPNGPVAFIYFPTNLTNAMQAMMLGSSGWHGVLLDSGGDDMTQLTVDELQNLKIDMNCRFPED